MHPDHALLKFRVVKIIEWGRNSEVSSSDGRLLMSWLELAKFNGRLSGCKLEGEWTAPMHQEPAPEFPTEQVAFSATRHSNHIEVTDEGRRVSIYRSEDQWGTALLTHSCTNASSSAGAADSAVEGLTGGGPTLTDNHNLTNRLCVPALVVCVRAQECLCMCVRRCMCAESLYTACNAAHVTHYPL